VHVVYLIDSLIAGGAERSLAALAPHFRRLGVELDVAYLYADRDNVWLPALHDAGAELFDLDGPQGRIGAIRRAARVISTRRPDAVHTTLFDADITGRIATMTSRVPVACSLVNAAYGPEQLADPALQAWKVRAAQLLDAVTARRVTRFHAVSTAVADDMSRRLHLRRDRVDVIPRGRDANELGVRSESRRAAARVSLGLSDGDQLVLAVGRHEFQKGFDVLLAAFEKLRGAFPKARLVIAGREGAATATLRSLITDLHLDASVELLGFRSDVPELLCAADVFASPSRWEGSPGGVLEAMALETPIAATDIPAVREVFGGEECGWRIPSDDVDSLAATLGEVLTERTGDRTAAARARFLERYTIEGVAGEMVRFYERVVSR
jgi:glycosyltransferase involved in cell wall biosynthesis